MVGAVGLSMTLDNFSNGTLPPRLAEDDGEGMGQQPPTKTVTLMDRYGKNMGIGQREEDIEGQPRQISN